MSKPKDIPQDIWDDAVAVFVCIVNDEGSGDDREDIARAIMAERERCARVVEVRAPLYPVSAKLMCSEIASSIRAGEAA